MPAVVIANKFAKYCSACGVPVNTGAGVSVKESDKSPWLTYCREHAPKTITSVAPPIRRELTADGKVYIQPWANDPVELSLLRSLPGRVFKPEGRYWQVSLATDADCRAAIAIARRLGCKIAPSLTGTSKEATRAIAAGLYPYQVEGVEWLRKEPRRLLADDMGLGKGVQGIMALEEDEAVLIVCPTNVKYNWVQEFAVWRPSFKVYVMTGKNNFRWPQPGEVAVVTYNSLPSWLVPKKDENYISWSDSDNAACRRITLICDEAHRIKNSATLQARKVKQLSHKAKKVWFFTGTPLTNKAKDLMDLLKCLKLFDSTFGNFDNFVARMNVLHNGFGYDWTTARPDASVPGILSKVMLRRTREEVLPDLPDVQYQTLFIDEMGGRLKKLLDNGWTEFESWFNEKNKLPPFEKFSEIRKAIAADRIPAMVEFVEGCEDQEVPLVVFSAHREPIDKLYKRPGWAVITGETSARERQDIIEGSRAGKYLGVGCTIAAGSEGTDLTFAWTALFVDLDWTPSRNEQAERRLLRIGQKSDKIRVVHMVSNHPLDKRAYQILTQKNKLYDGVFGKG